MSWPYHSQDLTCNSPYCLWYISSNINFDKLELDQEKNSQLIFFFILIICPLDIVFVLWGEIMSWLIQGVKGPNKLFLNGRHCHYVFMFTLVSLAASAYEWTLYWCNTCYEGQHLQIGSNQKPNWNCLFLGKKGALDKR